MVESMVIDNKILDELSAQAKASPRLRMAKDLRNTPEDLSQRMLNALEPGTIMPIHICLYIGTILLRKLWLY
jgi:hypothetical protein